MSNRFSWPAAIVCLLLACSEDRPGDAPAPLPVQSAGVGAELDQQLRGVASCATNDKGELDMKCLGARSFVDWSNKNKAWLDANAVEVSDITRSHLDAEAPATGSGGLHSIQVNLETLSGRQIRPQSLEIGLYRLSGDRVALSDKVRIDFENDGPAEIAGKWKCPDFVYANHNDHGYINTVLDRRSVEFVTRHISKISDATTRAMIWNDLWRMVRETELPLKSYVSVLRSGLSSEKNDLILQQVVGTLAGRGVGSVLNYWPSNERSQTELFNFVSEMEN